MLRNRLGKVLMSLFGIMIFVVTGLFNYQNTAASPSCVIEMEGGDYRDYITGTGTYFDWIRAFYHNGNGQVAYCTQSNQNPAVGVDNVYTPDTGAICNSEELHKTVTSIASCGYPLNYNTYIVGGNMKSPEYKTGLMIGGTIYECTEAEARAATAFAIHRKMIEYTSIDSEAAEGNEVTITSISNGRSAVHDVVAIQEALYSGVAGADSQYSITIQWVNKNADGSYTVVDYPDIVSSNGYFDFYAKVSSQNCYVTSIAAAEGDGYVSGCIIEDIQYNGLFERYVHIKVPKADINNKSFGLLCSSIVPETDKALVLGSDSYQDFMIVPGGKQIDACAALDYPGGELLITKKDAITKCLLPDAVYGIYTDMECKNQLREVKTDENGCVCAQNMDSGVYYVKEKNAPYGYLIDKNVYTVNIKCGERTSVEFLEQPVKASIEIVKWDADLNAPIPQGDAELSGAVYNLYAREDIVYPDKNSEVKYKAGDLVGQVTIGADCRGQIDNLYLGKYYVKEQTAPYGYMLDENEYDIDCSVCDCTSEKVKAEKILTDRVKSQAFQLIKTGSEENSEQPLIKGAGFTVWLLSDLKIKENGEYDFDSAKPYPAALDGGYEIFTDKNGYACSARLPYGTYIVKETTIPPNYLPVRDFIVTIDSDSNEPQAWRILKDNDFMVKLKIIKTDASTGITIRSSGYKFKIYDMVNECYLEYKTNYGETVCEFETNDEGILILPMLLKAGKYRIEEVDCPEGGYLLSKESIIVDISDDTAYEVDDGIPVVSVEFPDYPIYGSITIRKKYEIKDIIKNELLKDSKDTPKTVFSLYAAEDIFSYDNNVDENGERVKLYSKDEKIHEMYVSMEVPYFTIDKLPIGKYYIIEDKTLPGYVPLEEPVEVNIEYKDKLTGHIEVEVEAENNLTETKIYKKDKQTDETLPGSHISLYDESGQILDTWISDDLGHVVKGLELGKKYILIEEKAPEGYSVAEKTEFTVEKNNQEITLYNERVKIVLDGGGTMTTTEITTEDIPPTEINTPQTGDSFSYLIYGVMALVAGVIAAVLRFLLKDQ